MIKCCDPTMYVHWLDLGSLFDSVSNKKFFFHIDFFSPLLYQFYCVVDGMVCSLIFKFEPINYSCGVLNCRASYTQCRQKNADIAVSLAFQCGFFRAQKYWQKWNFTNGNNKPLRIFMTMTPMDTNYRHRLAEWNMGDVGERYRANMLSCWEITFSFRFLIDDTNE